MNPCVSRRCGLAVKDLVDLKILKKIRENTPRDVVNFTGPSCLIETPEKDGKYVQS